MPAAPEAIRQDTDISAFARDERGIWWANFRGLDLMRRIGDQWRPARDDVAVVVVRPRGPAESFGPTGRGVATAT